MCLQGVGPLQLIILNICLQQHLETNKPDAPAENTSDILQSVPDSQTNYKYATC